MLLRVFSFLLLLLLITSCDKFSFSKSKSIQVLDTIVNFSSVDTSPSFKECDSIIDKQLKSNCFRTTIYQKIGAELHKHEFVIRDAISEIVYVDLLINANGKIIMEAIFSSEEIKNQLPQLDSILRISIDRIPRVYAAIKRGIPVTTKYRLPIKIALK
ncbi:MAG: hypothetical protein ACI9JT_000148 [Polaribacter sp.]|jgi:hypothetical protein